MKGSKKMVEDYIEGTLIVRGILNNALYARGKLRFEIEDNLEGYEAKATILGYKTIRYRAGDIKVLVVGNEDEDVTIVTAKPLLVQDTSYLFADTHYSEINISNLILAPYLDKADSMFRNCNNLERVVFGKQELNKLRSVDYMFENCGQLREIDASEVSLSSLCNIEGVFQYCERLKKVLISKRNKLDIEVIDCAFYYCGLEEMDLSWLKLGECVLYSGLMRSKVKKLSLPYLTATQIISLFYEAVYLDSLEVLRVRHDISKSINVHSLKGKALKSKAFKKMEVYKSDGTIDKTYKNVSTYPEAINLVLEQ